MKNTHKAIATLAIISALGATTAFAASENANNANSDSTTRPQFQRGSQERMENRPQFTEMNAAIESGDYEAWVALHDGRNSALLDVINADNFSKLKEMHEARQSGDIETAEAIASELGLPTPPQGRMGGMGGNGMKGQGMMGGQSTEMNAAIESGDYEAWVALHDGRNSALLDVINADNFSKLKEMHEARQSGDIETAEAIASELGLPTPPQGRMGGNGMKGQGRSK